MKLKTGDIILCPKENTDGVYNAMMKWVEETFKDNVVLKVIGKYLVEYLADQVYNHNYIHTEIYLGNGWQMGAWFNGVHLWKPNLQYYTNVHIYRPKKTVNPDVILNAANQEFNKGYDFTSLILNSLITLLALNSEERERAFEDVVSKMYSDSNNVICSELVARILASDGIIIEPHTEYVTPDDIAQSDQVERVL